MAKYKLYKLHYGQQVFEYSVQYKENFNKKRKLAIHVYPTGLVQVDAPCDASIAEIKQGLLKRARWVLEQLNGVSKRKEDVLVREYVSGETLFYLGRRYSLKVDKRLKGNEVKLYQGKIIVPGRDNDSLKVKALLEHWYRERASFHIEKRLLLIASKLPWVQKVPKWKLIKMKRQWGSCSVKGSLSINPELIKAPMVCIDYVLLHELCHLKEHNHSKQFYRLLDAHMHDWQAIKYKLDDMAELLLNT